MKRYKISSTRFIPGDKGQKKHHPEFRNTKERAFYSEALKGQCTASAEAVTEDVLSKKVFSKIWQNSKESTCSRVSFLTKLQAEDCSFIKKEGNF